MKPNSQLVHFDEISERDILNEKEYRDLFGILFTEDLRLQDIRIELCWGSIGTNVSIYDRCGNFVADITDYSSW